MITIREKYQVSVPDVDLNVEAVKDNLVRWQAFRDQHLHIAECSSIIRRKEHTRTS